MAEWASSPGSNFKLQLEGANIALSDNQKSGVYINNDTIEELRLKTSGKGMSR